MIESLIGILVPFAVSEAEKALGPQSQSPDWVHGLVGEIFSVIERAIPGWLRPEEEALKQLVSDAVEKVLNLKK